MRKSMSAKSRLKLILMSGIVIIAVLVIIGLVVTYKGTFDNFYSRKVSLDATKVMTVQQRTEDFDLICSQLENNVPMLYDYEQLYGIGYDETKAYYKNQVTEAGSDFEYYTIVSGFMNNIPSIHMAVGFPLMASIDEDFAPHLEKNKSFVEAQNYWFDVLHTKCQEYYNTEINQLVFSYYSGEYRGISNPVDNDIYGVNKGVLLTVNGVPADDFVLLNSSVVKLKYDHVQNKPFREVIAFNDSFGEKCVIEYLDEQGEKHSLETYCGAEAETVINYINYFKQVDELVDYDSSELNSDSKVDYTVVGDLMIIKKEEQNLLIISADSFTSPFSDGDVIADTITALSKGVDNVVIDIRNNRGGYYEYAKRFLGALSDKDIETDSEIYITEASYNRNKDKSSYEFDSETGLYKTNLKEVIVGEAEEKKNLYLLVSDSTGSAADMIAYEFKENNLGTIIGINNTGGESDGTICLNYSTISGMYYTYTEYSSFNSDGTVNSVYGTAPDIYIDTNIENYFIRNELIENGEDPYTYENRLKWDNVLIETLEIIEEKENTK